MRHRSFESVFSERIDKNYATRNVIIRMVLNRLLKRIETSLSGIDATSGKGLEIGCGEGNIIDFLYKNGVVADITAVDLQLKKLAYAKHHVPFANYCASDIDHLAFQNNVFDYILAVEIFEHLNNPDRALKELTRVAKSGAYLLISVPHEPFFHWGNLARGKYLKRMGRTPSHINFWNSSQFSLFLRKSVCIHRAYRFATFPWLFYLCQFPEKKCNSITYEGDNTNRCAKAAGVRGNQRI